MLAGMLAVLDFDILDASLEITHKTILLIIVEIINYERPFAYVAIDHQPLTALEQWKASKHRLL